MDSHDKAISLLELLRSQPLCTNPSYTNGGGLHEFATEHAGVKHRVCFPDDLVSVTRLEDLAVVAACVFDLLRSDEGPARVIVRDGMFKTMLTHVGMH
ncbi:MAG: hypothetical protein WDZ63_04385 [Burkholderiales bacterium]